MTTEHTVAFGWTMQWGHGGYRVALEWIMQWLKSGFPMAQAGGLSPRAHG